MIRENLQTIFDEISSGNNLGEEITLVGAIKMQTAQIVNEAISCGLVHVGENKAQEFRDKDPFVDKSAIRHFFGRIQTNKLKYIVGKVFLIQSVDSLAIAQGISTRSEKLGITSNILIEINVAGDENKGGISLDNIKDFVNEVSNLPNVKILGLMTILPESDNEEFLAPLFEKARQIYDQLKPIYNFKYLSMGMSGDYKIAIKHGSNMIRVGSKIFGQRDYGDK